MKKRYILLGLVLAEIAAIPVAAQILQSVKGDGTSFALHAKIPDGIPGKTRMFVSANTPFVITAKAAVSEFKTVVISHGTAGQQSFGQNAQLPGPAFHCARPSTSETHIIYTSSLPTIKTSGDPTSQAVLISIQYDKDTQPEFDVIKYDQATPLVKALPCR